MDWTTLIQALPPIYLGGELNHVVLTQEKAATALLVSSLEHLAVLEGMLESVTPPLAPGSGGLHQLLVEPFRHPSLEWGSRYAHAHSPSLLYGSHNTQTALAEAAYHRFIFWHGMTTPPTERILTQHTSYAAIYGTERGLQLSGAVFDEYIGVLTGPKGFTESQALGGAIREAEIRAIEYPSVYAPHEGINIALYSPEPFNSRRPTAQDDWICELSHERVYFSPVHGGSPHQFQLEPYLVDWRGGCPNLSA